MFKHEDISADFGYIHCSVCYGEWEGPESPSNSPCDQEAQQIRKIRSHYDFLIDIEEFEQAKTYLEVCKWTNHLAFQEDGELKEVYWNDTGSTL